MSVDKQISQLPSSPGVYLFKDQSNKIIYIGKAINLKSRVRSYWNESCWPDRPKLKVMVPKITNIETIITKSEKEALILESNLVFKHQPKYNVLLKASNKTFPWLVITYDEPFPRLIPVRDPEKFKAKVRGRESKNKFFGPYTNISAMYENLNLVNELFPLRKKRVPPFKDRPCLNYDLGKCLGPCQKLVTEEDYAYMLEQVEMLLKGNYGDLKSMLVTEMQRYSEDLEYEKAAKARDRINALETFNEVQNVISDDINLDQDVFALIYTEDRDTACVQVFKTRAGRLINRETIELELNEVDTRHPAKRSFASDAALKKVATARSARCQDTDDFNTMSLDDEVYESALMQYYSQVPDSELPKEILLNKEIYSMEVFSDWLSERKGSRVKIFKPQRGDKYAQLKLAERNGKVIIEKIKLEQMEEASRNINVALTNLQKYLDMRTEPQRIECFDISHIQGHATVASMVCFIDGMPVKEQYRRYKISRDQNNDFDSMREVITRRYKANVASDSQGHIESFGDLPNLIIIDGGKGQLNAAYQVLKEYELDHIKVVGLAKKEEELYLPGESKPIILDRKSPELFFVQRIRNEAHRFAITYHRQLRSKRSLASVLDSVPGLGPKKKKAVLKAFPSLTKIKEASLEELASLSGVNEGLAQKIKLALS